VGLSLRRVVGFGGCVRGGKPSTNGNHDDEWTMRKWESLRVGGGCPCGGLWVSAGASVGGKPSTNGNHDDEWTMCKWESASGWGRLSVRRVVGFGGCVRGGKPSTNGTTITNERCANGSHFGVGEAVPAAGCGFRRACLWGEGDQRMGSG
jgi:hypothetical protein